MLKTIKKYVTKKTGVFSAVIVAAGNASRMTGIDKVLHQLGPDPIIVHTIRAFQEHSCIKEIVVVTRQDLIEEIKKFCDDYAFDKVTAITQGGSDRVRSVMNGLDHVSSKCSYAVIHDGARPFVTEKIISDTIDKAIEYHAAAPAVPVKDTVKVVTGHIVSKTPDRSTLRAVQTPQIFDFDLIRGALTKALKEGTPITDDCSAVEAMGMSVYLTEGSDENIKITTPIDLMIAKAIWEGRK